MDYDKILETLTAEDHNKFTSDPAERREATQQLQNNEGIDALVVIGTYRFIRNHFEVEEPDRQIEVDLNNVWFDILKLYGGLSPEQFLKEAAKHYHGAEPATSEILPSDTYDKIYSAFHMFHLPAMVMGRVDSRLFAGDEPEYSLQRILTGFENLQSGP